MPLPRMRTIKQTIAELKAQDENTSISEHYLRKLVKTGVIPSVNTGHKILINIDTIGDYITASLPEEETPKIRRISVGW